MSSAHIILDALSDAVHERIANGELDAAVLDGLPQSNVFYPDYFDPDNWDEDTAASIKAVGESDVQAKIDFYRRVLDQ